MPTFSKSPPELVARFAELAELVPTATRRQMFGYPSCVLAGHLFMGLYEDSLFLRLSESDLARFGAELGGRPFEPMPGRPMRGYVVVPANLVESDTIAEWVIRSFEFAGTLPPKKPKQPKAKKTG